MKNPLNAFHDRELEIDSRFKKRLYNQLIKEAPVAKAKKSINPTYIKQALFQAPITAIFALSLILLVAVSGYALQSNKQSSSRGETISDKLEVPADLSGVLSVADMKSKATADIPSGAKIVSVELENEDGSIVYKVRFSDGSIRIYNAKTGAPIVKTVSDDDSANDANLTVSLQEARNIAAAKRPGQTITKIELETENGVRVYSVRFADGGRVDVNANTGAVVRISNSETSGSSSSSNDDGNDGNSTSGSSKETEDKPESEDKSTEDNSGSGSNKDSQDDSGRNRN